MRYGINSYFPHESPEAWAELLKNKGLTATAFPVNYTAADSVIDAYVKAFRDLEIEIAEVGIWNSPFAAEKEVSEKNQETCRHQLELADYVHARCCVNVSGSAGDCWYGCCRENYSDELYQKNIDFVQRLLDAVKPEHTFYSLEIMQWMVPDSAECYLQMIKDINRERFAVHFDPVNLVNHPRKAMFFNEMRDQAVDLLAPYIKSCHIKDFVLLDSLTVQIREVLPGTGIADIPSYLRKIRKLNPEMTMIIEHLKDWDAYDKAIQYVLSCDKEICKEN